MTNTSTVTMETSLEISNQDICGPMNLKETVLSAQTSEPEWVREGESFTDVEMLEGIPVKYTLTQQGGVDDCKIRASVIASITLEKLNVHLSSHLEKVLGFKDDLDAFYKRFSDEKDPLNSTFPRLRGLRLMRGTNLYESLICSVLSQNNSVLLWNRTARLLMQLYGTKVTFTDGSTYSLFPKPEILARLAPRTLRSKTSMGYRAKPVVQVSRMVARDELHLEELVKRPYDEAMEILLELPGVGPKVADCFLLYGASRLEAAPVDVWIHRIVSKLYFPGEKISRLKTARFLRDRYEGWAGYAQLYLFDYARRVGIGK